MAADLVLSEDEYLEALASRIRSEVRRSKEAIGEIVESYFTIGQALLEAREALLSDQAFGAWFRAQEFGFERRWGHVLRTAAEYEAPVRAAVGSQLPTGRAINFEKTVKQVVAEYGAGRATRPALSVVHAPADEPRPTEFPAIVIDPPWRYDNKSTRGAAEDHYPTMSYDDLFAIELPSAANAHLYLWVTNSFFEDGFALMRSWGFTYKTCLTWCKPQIGMGNYFRATTEHVLFGVRGTLGTLRKDIPTHFIADRTKHSAKPESFYDIVEKSSPGPWLEMFARRRRMGWHTWGNEA